MDSQSPETPGSPGTPGSPDSPQTPGVPPTGPTPDDAAGPEPNKDARNWGMFCHLSALAGYVIPFGNIIGPIVIWMMKREEFPFVEDQGKESLNFQITVMIAVVICIALSCVVIGFFLLPIVGVGALVLIIIAAIKASKGEYYRYPLTLRLIK